MLQGSSVLIVSSQDTSLRLAEVGSLNSTIFQLQAQLQLYFQEQNQNQKCEIFILQLKRHNSIEIQLFLNPVALGILFQFC